MILYVRAKIQYHNRQCKACKINDFLLCWFCRFDREIELNIALYHCDIFMVFYNRLVIFTENAEHCLTCTKHKLIEPLYLTKEMKPLRGLPFECTTVITLLQNEKLLTKQENKKHRNK